MKRNALVVALAVALVLAVSASAEKATSFSYILVKDVIANGGGESTSTGYGNVGALGDPAAIGSSTSASFQNQGGFLGGGADVQTVVDLLWFRAGSRVGFVHTWWATASEKDNAGFHVWRRAAPAGEWDQVTAQLIPAEGSPFEGAQYAFNDADVTVGAVYDYKLEDVDYFGRSSFHAPVRVAYTGQAINPVTHDAPGARGFRVDNEVIRTPRLNEAGVEVIQRGFDANVNANALAVEHLPSGYELAFLDADKTGLTIEIRRTGEYVDETATDPTIEVNLPEDLRPEGVDVIEIEVEMADGDVRAYWDENVPVDTDLRKGNSRVVIDLARLLEGSDAERVLVEIEFE